jgi:hypothetical protein
VHENVNIYGNLMDPNFEEKRIIKQEKVVAPRMRRDSIKVANQIQKIGL